MEKKNQGFEVVIENNIRKFTQVLNDNNIKKEEIVKILYKPASNEYIAITYR